MGEMTARFRGSNLTLLEAVESLLPSSKAFMQPAVVKPLAYLLQLQSRDAGGRIDCGSCLSPKETASHSTLETVTKEMLQFKDAFSNVLVVCSCFDYWNINCNVQEQLLYCHQDPTTLTSFYDL